MDNGATGLLESVTHKTLHAQNFSRASSQASHVLTDLLSRYISLLATTCAQYAEHAGRGTVSIHDAVLAFDELGVSVDELSEYAEGEGRELARYAGSTARRAEELTLLKDALADGRRQENDDAIALVFAEMPTPSSLMDEDDDEEAEAHVNGDFAMPNGNGKADVRMVTPTLPPSPISNPSSPARKRARLANWNPPSHIPDFLPPYPTSLIADASPPPSPLIKAETESILPPVSALERERERLPTPPPQQLSTATSAADYLTPVPYNMSSLSSVPESHLSDWHNSRNVAPIHGHALQLQKRKHEPPAIMPSLVTAYHHILTHPPPSHPSTNPARHRVALAMLAQAYKAPRWSAADTLFANGAAPRPRVVAPAPTYPVSLSTGKGKDEPPPVMPASTSRPVMVPETVVPLSHQPSSRIPDIARAILPLSVFNRATRVNPPPPLVNTTSKEKFLYGTGMPAPWNANPFGQPVAPVPGRDKGKSKDGAGKGDGGDDEGHGKGKDKDADKDASVLADATLFATWDWDPHDYRLPLPANKRGRAVGSFNLGAPGEGGAEAGGFMRKNPKAGREGKGK